MGKILKQISDLYAKGSEEGVYYAKTALYYAFIPTVLYLGI